MRKESWHLLTPASQDAGADGGQKWKGADGRQKWKGALKGHIFEGHTRGLKQQEQGVHAGNGVLQQWAAAVRTGM